MNQDQLLGRVSRPSRYLGGELGTVSKDLASVEVSFALAFPDVYEVGMSHIGVPMLYHAVNSLDWAVAERVYAPWPDMAAELRENGLPLTALESLRPLAEFDLLGFTLQHELSYTNILAMLELAGIPLRREQRDAQAPLVVVGGPCATNPEPLADFIDCAVIGDGEEAIVRGPSCLKRWPELTESTYRPCSTSPIMTMAASLPCSLCVRTIQRCSAGCWPIWRRLSIL